MIVDTTTQCNLRVQFRQQEKKQKQNGEKKWVTWRPPIWATEGNYFSFEERDICIILDGGKKCSSCERNTRKHGNEHIGKRSIECQKAADILEVFIQMGNHKEVDQGFVTCQRKEQERCDKFELEKRNLSISIHMPKFRALSDDLLHQSYEAMRRLLPEGDCEDFEVVNIAKSYYDYWRPKKVKIILLAESHVYTHKERACSGPGLDPLLKKRIGYDGPSKHLSLVYCLTYGENEAIEKSKENVNMYYQPNTGSSQFWSLLAACSRGVKKSSGDINKTQNKYKYNFSADILKCGGLSCKERLSAKLNILHDLKQRGIWLIDTSLVGWYIPQEQMFKRSKVTNDVHRLAKQRPPKNYKIPALALSWETYTKHVVRKAVLEDNLKLIIPIGMEIAKVITCERLKEVVYRETDHLSQVKVVDPFPAPNAWIPGGYGYFYERLAHVVHKAAPPISKHPSISMQEEPLV